MKAKKPKGRSTTPLVPDRPRDDSDAIFETVRGAATVDAEVELEPVLNVRGVGNIQDGGNDGNRPARGARRGQARVPDDFQPANGGLQEVHVVINPNGQANQPLTGWRRKLKIAWVKGRAVVTTGYSVLYGFFAGVLSTGSFLIFNRYIIKGLPYEYSKADKVVIVSVTAFSAIVSGYTTWYSGNRRGTFSGLDNDVRTLVGMQLQIWPYIESLKDQNNALALRWQRQMARREFLRLAEQERIEPGALQELARVNESLSVQELRANRVQQSAVYPLLADMKDTLDSVMVNRNRSYQSYFHKPSSRILYLVLMVIGLLTFGYSIGFGFPTYLPLNWNAIISEIGLDVFLPFVIFGAVSAPFKAIGFGQDAYNNNANDRLLVEKLPDVVDNTQLLIDKAEATLAENNALVRQLYPQDPIVAPSSWDPDLEPDQYVGHQQWLEKHDELAQFQPVGVPMAAGVPGSSAYSGVDPNNANRFFSVNNMNGAHQRRVQRGPAQEQPLIIREERRGPAPGRSGQDDHE